MITVTKSLTPLSILNPNIMTTNYEKRWTLTDARLIKHEVTIVLYLAKIFSSRCGWPNLGFES